MESSFDGTIRIFQPPTVDERPTRRRGCCHSTKTSALLEFVFTGRGITSSTDITTADKVLIHALVKILQSHVLLVMRVLILVAVVILASLLGFFSFYVLHRVDTRRVRPVAAGTASRMHDSAQAFWHGQSRRSSPGRCQNKRSIISENAEYRADPLDAAGQFEADHSTISELIGVQVTRNLDTAITCLEDLAGTLDLPPGGRSLFFHFEKSAKLKSTLSGARSYSVLPLVPAIERQARPLWTAAVVLLVCRVCAKGSAQAGSQ